LVEVIKNPPKLFGGGHKTIPPKRSIMLPLHVGGKFVWDIKKIPSFGVKKTPKVMTHFFFGSFWDERCHTFLKLCLWKPKTLSLSFRANTIVGFQKKREWVFHIEPRQLFPSSCWNSMPILLRTHCSWLTDSLYNLIWQNEINFLRSIGNSHKKTLCRCSWIHRYWVNSQIIPGLVCSSSKRKILKFDKSRSFP